MRVWPIIVKKNRPTKLTWKEEYPSDYRYKAESVKELKEFLKKEK